MINNYKYIKNPYNNKFFKTNSKNGLQIIKNYIRFINGGASKEEKIYIKPDSPFITIHNALTKSELINILEEMKKIES